MAGCYTSATTGSAGLPRSAVPAACTWISPRRASLPATRAIAATAFRCGASSIYLRFVLSSGSVPGRIRAPPRATAATARERCGTSAATGSGGRPRSARPTRSSCASTRRTPIPATSTTVPTAFRCGASSIYLRFVLLPGNEPDSIEGGVRPGLPRRRRPWP